MNTATEPVALNPVQLHQQIVSATRLLEEKGETARRSLNNGAETLEQAVMRIKAANPITTQHVASCVAQTIDSYRNLAAAHTRAHETAKVALGYVTERTQPEKVTVLDAMSVREANDYRAAQEAIGSMRFALSELRNLLKGVEMILPAARATALRYTQAALIVARTVRIEHATRLITQVRSFADSLKALRANQPSEEANLLAILAEFRDPSSSEILPIPEIHWGDKSVLELPTLG